jgi:Domain of unknown function (DUF4397)
MTRACKSLMPGILLLGATMLWLGCGTDHARVRFMDASPNTPNLDVLVGGKTVVTNGAYESVTSYLKLDSGTRRFEVRATGTSTDLIDTKATLAAHQDYTFLAVNALPITPVMLVPLALIDDNSAPASGQVKVRLIQASPSAGSVDVYLVAPGTDITTVSPTVTSLAYQVATSYQSLTAGSYEVFVTPTGSKAKLLDSGTLTLTAGQIRTGVILDDPGGGTITFPGVFVVLADLN